MPAGLSVACRPFGRPEYACKAGERVCGRGVLGTLVRWPAQAVWRERAISPPFWDLTLTIPRADRVLAAGEEERGAHRTYVKPASGARPAVAVASGAKEFSIMSCVTEV